MVGRFFRERKGRLVAQINPEAGSWVLDIGCGTGTLVLMLHERDPGLRLVGADADPDVLALAQKKARERGARPGWVAARAEELPFPPATFDRIASSLAFHHLGPAAKREAFAEAHRVLGPHGSFHLLDFGAIRTRIMRLVLFPLRLLEDFAAMADHVHGRLVERMNEAGFRSAQLLHREASLLGPLEWYRAVSPAARGLAAECNRPGPTARRCRAPETGRRS